ncbi:MAG TPA: D-alanine--D-alanine ligase family protein [Bryobacteraceae bacterium]|nr:D-alanine--D-alanine ligase family protein [Bryobacteraceae bacterium]
MTKLNVAVLYGGRSGEHEISVRSAQSVLRALNRDRYNVAEIFITNEGRWQPRAICPEPGANPGIDVVFPVLHGTFGEDGTVQGLLELAELPYVGAGVLASAVSMDKAMTKRVCKEAGLPVVEYLVLARQEAGATGLSLPFPLPVFVKPANLGSSVGINKAKNQEEFRAALETAFRYDRKIVVERGITGREFECSVLGGNPPTAATPCEVLPSREFYDYEDKYLLDKAVIELPAKLSAEQTGEMKCLAVKCFEAVGCEGMGRVDFLMETATGRLYVNEINTIPGFTSISMYPKMWEYSGIPYSALLDRLIALALDRAEAKRGMQYTK